MSAHEQTCGVVLAGGRSSRMGRDKAALRMPDGETFLEHALALLGDLPLQEVRVSGMRPGGVPDPVADLGPIGGLCGVARITSADSLLVIPVDMPLLSPAQLYPLLQAGRQSGRACYFGHFYLPLWLPLNAPVYDFLEEAVSGAGPNSIRALLARADALSLPLTDGDAAFHNINTPADYALHCTTGQSVTAVPGGHSFISL
ncbi:molybdenum cofactor guanylyltransferase [Microbulbifer hainanensis]|uniref:molybdenum cofactor guanylyltransferase n=1 Tax=Microbulbifer hainanensis TaxID=2735675 RepID=UPI0018691CC6|nr:molybdenum cofactor guanylyltransferase [Microbulbifer hainanensis]